MKKIRVTVVYEYTPNPEHYPGCTTIEEMAALDREQSLFDLSMLAAEEGTTTIEAVD